MAVDPESVSLDNYTFTALPANHKLLRLEDIEATVLDIRLQNTDCQKHFESVWSRMYAALDKYHQLAETGASPNWTKWNPGKWCGEREPQDRLKYAAWIGRDVAGFLNLRPSYPSIIAPEEKVLYLEHIAASPGNIATPIWGQRLDAVGSALTAFAVLQSFIRGFAGRVGLHAIAGAETYYPALNRSRETPVFREPAFHGIPGTPQDRNATRLPYFETIPEGARGLLEDYRNE